MKIPTWTPIGTVLIVAALAIYMICFPGSEMLLTIFLVMVLAFALLKACGWTERHDTLHWLIFIVLMIYVNAIAYETTAGTEGKICLFDLPLLILITVATKYILLVIVLLSGMWLLPDLFHKQ